MPYRIEKGSSVLLILTRDRAKTVVFDKTVDFHKKELIASPMDEHKGIVPISKYPNYPWGFSVTNKWSKGDNASEVEAVYADEVRSIKSGTPMNVDTVVVQGSKNNQYTVTLDPAGSPIGCTCPVNRYRQKPCKHMRRVAELRNAELRKEHSRKTTY